MTTKEYEDIRAHCVQKVQDDLKEAPMKKINEKTERAWISDADNGKKRWQRHLRCMVDSHPAIKYYAEEKCKEKEHGAYVIGGEYDKCSTEGWREVVVPAMFPEMTLHEMENIRKKCMQKVKKELGEKAVEPIPNLTMEKEEVWFHWFSADNERWQKYQPCLEDNTPAVKYCHQDVCGEFQFPQKFTANGPFNKCMEKCWEKVKSEEKKD